MPGAPAGVMPGAPAGVMPGAPVGVMRARLAGRSRAPAVGLAGPPPLEHATRLGRRLRRGRGCTRRRLGFRADGGAMAGCHLRLPGCDVLAGLGRGGRDLDGVAFGDYPDAALDVVGNDGRGRSRDAAHHRGDLVRGAVMQQPAEQRGVAAPRQHDRHVRLGIARLAFDQFGCRPGQPAVRAVDEVECDAAVGPGPLTPELVGANVVDDEVHRADGGGPHTPGVTQRGQKDGSAPRRCCRRTPAPGPRTGRRDPRSRPAGSRRATRPRCPGPPTAGNG